MHNPVPPDRDPVEFRYAQRRRAWGAFPILFAVVLILAALAYAARYREWAGVAFAAFVGLVLYFVGLRDVDRSGGQ